MNITAKLLRDTKYLITEVDALNLKASDAEVSFVGRSNAGKSTLINAICEKKKMAHASQVPGKTKTINVFEVAVGRWIVDLPGYGYTVGSVDVKEKLGQIIEGYLNSRKKLRMIFVIIDVVAGPTKLDMIMIDWLKHYKHSFSIIVNKIDKVKSSELVLRKKDIADKIALDVSVISWVSSKQNIGITDLQHVVAKLLNT